MRAPGPITRSDRDTHDRIDVEQCMAVGRRKREGWVRRSVAVDAPITRQMFDSPNGLATCHIDGNLVCVYRWPMQ